MEYLSQSQLAALAVFFVTAAAADLKTATVDVTATLQPACLAGTTSSGAVSFGTLNFGNQVFLTRSVGVSATAIGAGAIDIKCNAGVAYKVLLSAGNSGSVADRRMTRAETGETIRYNLFVDAAYAVVWDNQTGVSATATGSTEILPVYGRINPQPTPSPGVYSDTILVTVAW